MMFEIIDLSCVPILFGISFGSSSGGGSSQETRTENQGLSAAQKKPLSAYVGPQLQNLFQYATGYLYPTQPQTQRYKITSSAYGGPGPGQQPDSVYDNVTGAYLGPSTMTSNPGGGTNADFVNDPTKPAVYNPFVMPAIDQNGLYGGQTNAISELLNRAAGGLNTSAQGLESGVLANALPGLFDTIGAQTVAQVEKPEQVRQQRVQDVNAVLQLMSSGLGSSSAGSGSRNFSSSKTSFGLGSGLGTQMAANDLSQGQNSAIYKYFGGA